MVRGGGAGEGLDRMGGAGTFLECGEPFTERVVRLALERECGGGQGRGLQHEPKEGRSTVWMRSRKEALRRHKIGCERRGYKDKGIDNLV